MWISVQTATHFIPENSVLLTLQAGLTGFGANTPNIMMQKSLNSWLIGRAQGLDEGYMSQDYLNRQGIASVRSK